MRDLSIAPCSLSIVFVFLMALSASAQSTSQPLGSILNSDGSVNKNVTGSFDPSGYRLTHGPNGEPRFVAEPRSVGGSCAPDGWDTNFSLNGADQRLLAMASDGAGNFYIGGYFTAVNNVAANQVAKWNGTSWSALGSGISGGDVIAIAVSGSNVYFAGSFTSAGGIPANKVAKWDGTSWTALGGGLGAGPFEKVNAIAASGSDVYAGGTFLSTSGFPNRIARWDGASWVNMGTGVDDEVFAITVSGTDVYAGGRFANAGGVPAARIAKWDGNSWSALGAGQVGRVLAIAVSGTDVYAGGVLAGGSGHIAKWNGSSWQSLGSGVTGGSSPQVSSIAVSGTDIYVTGLFTTAGGLPANHIAKWNGTQWSPLGTGLGNSGWVIAVSGNTVMVGGSFLTAGGLMAKNIATYTSGTWTPFYGTGVESPGAVAVLGTDVYVGGSFTSAGTIPANRIAKWDGTTWSALGTGLNGTVSAIAVAGNKVYVGGGFSNAGGVSANNIAVWNGTNWAALGTGVNNQVGFIIPKGEDIYVGGSFTTAGGVTANRVAKWNGTAWSGLNSAHLPTSVSGMAFMEDNLYVGTGTTTIANPAYFSKYDGTNWTLLGAELGDGGVSSVAVSGGYVYVTGRFTSVGGVTVNNIARWNGSTWSALGGGLPTNPTGVLVRVAKMGPDLVATGNFTIADGAPANYIARWNGSSWSPMGAGLNGIAGTATVAGGDVWVSGLFTTAGCNLSAYLARWRENVWTGSTNTDWHTSANWGGGSVPPADAGVTIRSNNATISSADVTVSSLIVTGGRTLAIGAGRTLTVSGNLDLSNGFISGPGVLIVAGNLSLNGGDISGAAWVTILGSLYLNGGKIVNPNGPVFVDSCHAGAISGGSNTSFIEAPLRRCVRASGGTYRFPVGTGSTYAPVELSNISGFPGSNIVIEPKSGAYSNPATGLPANRLQRWWNISGVGIQGDLTFTYTDSEVVGIEGRYRAYRIIDGVAAQVPSTINLAGNRVTATGVFEFSSFPKFTLAEGTPAPLTLSGRVTTASGRGGWGVIVALTDDQNNTRYTMTNPFGYYRFPNVLTFKTYTLQVMHKKFTFTAPQRTVDFDEFTPAQNFQSTDH